MIHEVKRNDNLNKNTTTHFHFTMVLNFLSYIQFIENCPRITPYPLLVGIMIPDPWTCTKRSIIKLYWSWNTKQGIDRVLNDHRYQHYGYLIDNIL